MLRDHFFFFFLDNRESRIIKNSKVTEDHLGLTAPTQPLTHVRKTFFLNQLLVYTMFVQFNVVWLQSLWY